MAELLLYQHIQGLTDGVRAFADDLRQAGQSVHTPDFFEGRTFGSSRGHGVRAGNRVYISPEEHERLMRGPDEGLVGIAWGKCWDRAEALRADLERAVDANEALRARVITTKKYVKQQQAASPLRGGDNRHRLLETLPSGPTTPASLNLASATAGEAP
ncbi:hypothetical protein [Streptomyces chromofuscus]|uniref:hypothetical protein n=1 Tax=Streptomyces chromofuscus TaxID=42881 RepID=UPI0019A71CA0|nr:hypothetical protein GCM10010254_75190 [Streptomyces chromofuscus]